MADFTVKRELTAAVVALIAEALSIQTDAIGESLAYGDIPEWDSLGHMNIMMALEQKYSIALTGDFISGMTSIEKIIDYLMDRKHA